MKSLSFANNLAVDAMLNLYIYFFKKSNEYIRLQIAGR